ncbi:glycoside hydrolase [Magnaporthiopsis poae ATCC 64411]|uniref:alpha-glucosidase n=1 Tax=Magnaporthiopsis poae (strain ATCC 64411 / 73-15) TaxID=644358 RepID=A0A0C4EBP1_MAGP6|nr:glycoside hydrolase [Magnaporthiopsis poae ATCC 64411]
MGGDRDDERTARWIQLGCFSPVLRLHSTRSDWVAKEPWRLLSSSSPSAGGPREAATLFLRLRHRLLPYLHSMNLRAAVEGLPLVQPLYWEYQKRDEAYRYENSYLFGTELLVMPITEPADPKLGLARMKGWLPPGAWVDFFQGTVYGGDRELWISRPLALYPVFAKAGAIIPLDDAAKPTNGAANPEALEVVIVVGADGAFDLHEEPDEDDEAGRPEELELVTTSISFNQAKGRVDIRQPSRSPLPRGKRTRTWRLSFPGWRPEKPRTTVYLENNGSGLATPRFETVEDGRGVGLKIHNVPLGAHIIVELGAAPGFARNDARRRIRAVLDAAQIEYALKEAVWAALGGDGDEPARLEVVARLAAVDMSEELRAAVMEPLVADEGAQPTCGVADDG